MGRETDKDRKGERKGGETLTGGETDRDVEKQTARQSL